MSETVQETSNGVIVRAANGHFQKGTKPANVITPENARLMHERRKEKAAALLRQQISIATLGADMANKAPEAVARVGAQLWAEIAANPEANARYRLETWQTIGRHAGILGDSREKSDENGVNITIGADLARDMVAQILAARSKTGANE